MTAEMYEGADGRLKLRVPLAFMAPAVVPTLFSWLAGGALVAKGKFAPGAFVLVLAIPLTIMVIRLGRAGATVDRSGIEVRTIGKTRWVQWRDVEGFSVLHMGMGRNQLLVSITGGESLPIIGLPNRSYRRQHYLSGRVLNSKLLDNVAADLQRRLQTTEGPDTASPRGLWV